MPPPPESAAEDGGDNVNRLMAEEKQKTPSVIAKEEDSDKILAVELTEQVRVLQPPRGVIQ